MINLDDRLLIDTVPCYMITKSELLRVHYSKATNRFQYRVLATGEEGSLSSLRKNISLKTLASMYDISLCTRSRKEMQMYRISTKIKQLESKFNNRNLQNESKQDNW